MHRDMKDAIGMKKYIRAIVLIVVKQITKFTILTIFQRTVKYCEEYSHCYEAALQHNESSSQSQEAEMTPVHRC